MLNVLVADDEIPIRQGIVELIDWPRYNCQVCHESPNGQDALNALEEKSIDIIITDIKMPIMDGLELCRQAKKLYPHIQIIILTAFSDFSYAQTAIHLDVCEFIVKNNFLDELPQALNKCREQIQLNDHPQNKKTFIHLLKEFLLSEASEPNHELNSHEVAEKECCLINFDFSQKKEDQLIKRFDSICAIAFSQLNFILSIEPDFKLLLLYPQRGEKLYIKKVKDQCRTLLKLWSNLTDSTLRLGISSIGLFPHNLNTLWQEAMGGLSHIFSKQSDYQLYSNIAETKDMSPHLLLNKKQITQAIFTQDKVLLEEEINDFFLNLKQSNESIDQYKMEILQLISNILHEAESQFYSKKPFVRKEELYLKISSSPSLISLHQSLSSILNTFYLKILEVQKHQHPVILKVSEYIKDNYKNHISLNDLSLAAGVGPTYLSRLYKKETGTNLSDAINLLKVEEAKSLLAINHHLKIYEISESIGISDPAYFTNVFKKYTGQSPQEYKRTIKSNK